MAEDQKLVTDEEIAHAYALYLRAELLLKHGRPIANIDPKGILALSSTIIGLIRSSEKALSKGAGPLWRNLSILVRDGEGDEIVEQIVRTSLETEEGYMDIVSTVMAILRAFIVSNGHPDTLKMMGFRP